MRELDGSLFRPGESVFVRFQGAEKNPFLEAPKKK
jgi:hypothetical protein